MGISTAPRQGCQRPRRRTATAEHPQFSARRHHLTNQGSQRFSQEAATVGSQRPPRPASEEPARPTHEGQRPPCQWTTTAESAWSTGRSTSWGSASASRHGWQRPCRQTAAAGQRRACQQPCPRAHAGPCGRQTRASTLAQELQTLAIATPPPTPIREPTLGLQGAALD